MNDKILALLISISTIIISSSITTNSAVACACCATQNTWSRHTRTASESEISILSELSPISGWIGSWSLAREPTLSMNEHVVPLSGSFISSNQWEFSFFLIQGTEFQQISFIFETDSEWEFFEVDINTHTAGETDEFPVTELYKEIVLTGKIILQGELARKLGTTETIGRLVFQGQGESCLGSSDFKKWILQFIDFNITGAGTL